MTFKAKVSLYSVDGEEWTVDVREYVTFEDDLVDGVLKEGDVLIRRPTKYRR